MILKSLHNFQILGKVNYVCTLKSLFTTLDIWLITVVRFKNIFKLWSTKTEENNKKVHLNRLPKNVENSFIKDVMKNSHYTITKTIPYYFYYDLCLEKMYVQH